MDGLPDAEAEHEHKGHGRGWNQPRWTCAASLSRRPDVRTPAVTCNLARQRPSSLSCAPQAYAVAAHSVTRFEPLVKLGPSPWRKPRPARVRIQECRRPCQPWGSTSAGGGQRLGGWVVSEPFADPRAQPRSPAMIASALGDQLGAGPGRPTARQNRTSGRQDNTEPAFWRPRTGAPNSRGVTTAPVAGAASLLGRRPY